MNWFERWFLRRLLNKMLGKQQVKLVVEKLARQSHDYYTETNRPTLEHHMHSMLQSELIKIWFVEDSKK